MKNHVLRTILILTIIILTQAETMADGLKIKSGSQALPKKAETVSPKWFPHAPYKSLSITRGDSKKITTVTDLKIINHLLLEISTLSAEGDIFISFGPDIAKKITKLTFSSAKSMDIDLVEVYGSSIKTPATSFGVHELQEKIVIEMISKLYTDG